MNNKLNKVIRMLELKLILFAIQNEIQEIYIFKLQGKVCRDPMIVDCKCPNCHDKLQNTINYAFKLCGWIGLFFSFSEVSIDKLFN